MRRGSAHLLAPLLAALGVLGSLGGAAVANEEAHGDVVSAPLPAGAPDTRASLAQQLTEQQTTIETAQRLVTTKLSAADALRSRRVKAAYRVLHAQLTASTTPDERMATARRRAAARLLLGRDLGERVILADELGKLQAARARAAAEVAQLPQVALPSELLRPAHGRIARKFGVLEHERSKATLSRHGIDVEVEDHVAVVAPADGVVRYAGPIRGLDHGIILDHGTYLSVLAKLGELALPVGTQVKAGERIGRAARHRLYLEVRVKVGPNSMPIDPEPLFGKSRP